MPRGVWGSGPTKDDLRSRIKEIENRIKQIDRREKSVTDLKKWMAARKLDYADLIWMMRQLKPVREDRPVKSKKPLQPSGDYFTHLGKRHPAKGDPVFRAAIQRVREERELGTVDVGKKIGVSGSTISSWERGRYVPSEEARAKLVKFLGLPADLGAEASKAMEASASGKRAKSDNVNGAAAHQ